MLNVTRKIELYEMLARAAELRSALDKYEEQIMALFPKERCPAMPTKILAFREFLDTGEVWPTKYQRTRANIIMWIRSIYNILLDIHHKKI